jgi:hypothetical protein
LYDSGKGEKFNEFTNNIAKPKQYKALLNIDDDIQYVENEQMKNINKDDVSETKVGPSENQTAKTTLLKNKQTNHQKKNDEMLSSETKMNKVMKMTQDYNSITGYKTAQPLPPSRGKKYPSLEPLIDRFRITGKEDPLLQTRITSQLDLHLTRPTTTIISLNEMMKKDDFAINNMTDEYEGTSENDKVTSENIIESKIKEDEKEEKSEEDQYMQKINDFIKQAFEGKDYRV